ncbi:Ankyrin repeat domain-containing protein 50 [Penicillium rolfsii]|nr:Ankyrin repeat domain-containing protein 50 [Penicillium rolfsii]
MSPLAKATLEWRHEGLNLNFCNSDGRTSIFFAVECRPTDLLRLLIDKGALLDWMDNEGRTSLLLAAELGHLDHVRILVESNADINLPDLKGWTPLFWAVSRQHLETAKYLLLIGDTGSAESIWCLIYAKEKGRRLIGIERDLLLWAVFRRDMETVQLLLEADNSLANYRVKGRTPLSVAIELGDVGMTKLLINVGADVQVLDETRWPTLSKWLFETYLPLDNVLLEIKYFSVNHHPTKKSLLLRAAEFAHVDILQVLLDASANVNSVDAKSWTALAWAVGKRHDAAIEVLLEAPEISVDSRDVTGRTPLMMAASLAIDSEDERKWTSLSCAVANNHKQTAELLLRVAGVCRTPFSLAAERGFTLIIQILIENGADPYISDDEGYIGFWWFLRARYALFTSSLNRLSRLALGETALVYNLPTLNKKDRSGRNWLLWAAEYGDDEVVEDKADRVDMNICDGTGDTFSRTPLIWALEGGSTASVDLLKDGDTISLHLLVEGISQIEPDDVLGLVTSLLQAGYNPNQPDEKGRTPLHLACLKGSRELVSALIKANANLGARDHTGKIPLQYALKAQSKAVVDLLLNAPSSDLKPVQSREWFTMEEPEPFWIQITRRIQNRGFHLELINELHCDWLPGAKEARLCICDNPTIWSLLPWRLGVHNKLNNEGYYWNYAHEDSGHRLVTYISLAFPCKQEKDDYSWGIAWTSTTTAEGLAYGFISMLPSGWLPNDPSDFFGLFLEALRHKWKATCSNANARVEALRHDQVKKRGRSYGLVDELAKNALERADLRQCLQSHIEGLLTVVKANSSLEEKHQSQLEGEISELDLEVTAKLDHMEQAVRDILQIELAWVSTNEAASFKRLSWITFIFLPLMFASSLFGMNVDLLQDNPDWRWFILFASVSLVITGVTWFISKCIPTI